jgi:polyferredoxin
VILPFGKLAAKVLAFPLLAFISGLSDLLPPGKGAATALAFSLLAFFYLLYLLLLGLLVVCGIVDWQTCKFTVYHFLFTVHPGLFAVHP